MRQPPRDSPPVPDAVRGVRRRSSILAGTVIIAALLVIFPPWRARAIRTTTRYTAVANVAPATVVDTVDWLLPFAALYAPPRASLTGAQMRDLAARSMAGDTAARTTLRRVASGFERHLDVPEILRTDGELWRDSVLHLAGIPAMSSYDLTIRIDQRWLAARLALLALIAFVLDARAPKRARSAPTGDRNH
jgi:hypothetical protein